MVGISWSDRAVWVLLLVGSDAKKVFSRSLWPLFRRYLGSPARHNPIPRKLVGEGTTSPTHGTMGCKGHEREDCFPAEWLNGSLSTIAKLSTRRSHAFTPNRARLPMTCRNAHVLPNRRNDATKCLQSR